MKHSAKFCLTCLLMLAGWWPAAGAAWGDWQQWGDQADGTYRNPVLPADFSDIDCIRVGSDYYAISSTFQYSPGMVILRSKDLVNWTIAGHAVTDLTQIAPELNWDRMDRFGRGIWAGAIRHHAGKFWVYFGTPDEGYFMTTATNIAGPWEPLTCLKRARGWDDCCPFWDDDGQGYFIGSHFEKDPVNGKKYNIHLWKLSPDGKALVEDSDIILHQSNGSEANKLSKWNGTYYHYFSEVKGEGRVPMMGRAKKITGPYEYRQISHVKKGVDYEPNQGGIVQSEAGDWWFFTHHGSGDWSGRIASLLPVTWTNGWPVIGNIGSDGIGNMVWSGVKPVKGTPRLTPQTDDEFSATMLGPQWEWHYQPRAGKWSLTERPGFLRLHAFKGLHGDNLLKVGNVLTQRPLRTSTNVVTVKLEVGGMADGQSAGLFHFTTAGYAGVGVSQTNGVRFLIYRSGLRMEPGAEVKGASVWLRSAWGLDGVCRFSQSLDGKIFEPVGEPYQMKWGSYRGDRIGLFNYNAAAAAGYVDFDSFHYEYTGQAGAAEASDTLDLGAMVQPVPADCKFSQPGYFVWCGAPVRGADGKYHLFYSRWPVKKGFHPGWAIHSEIAYAVSDQPLGPYHFVNVALPARGTNAATGQKFWDADMTHNPNIVVRDGKYLLYYIGNQGDGKYETHRNNDRIGVAIADKPEGPWRRFDQPIIDVSADAKAFDSLCVANPAAAVRPDGGLIVIYKAVPIVPGKVMGGNVRYGVAVADKPEGPYVKQPGRVFEAEGAEAKKHWMLAEDPYIWFSRKYGNRYYAVARDVVGKFTGASGGLALFESVDGFHWQAAEHPKVLDARFNWADGTTSHQNVERPALLFDGEEPIALFGATDGYQKNGRISFNVQIPLKPATQP